MVTTTMTVATKVAVRMTVAMADSGDDDVGKKNDGAMVTTMVAMMTTPALRMTVVAAAIDQIHASPDRESKTEANILDDGHGEKVSKRPNRPPLKPGRCEYLVSVNVGVGGEGKVGGVLKKEGGGTAGGMEREEKGERKQQGRNGKKEGRQEGGKEGRKEGRK